MDRTRGLVDHRPKGLAPQLPFGLKPFEDELLSSYLARNACIYGLNPTRFCRFHLQGYETWNRDIDRSVSDKGILRIASLFHLQPTQVEHLTLREFEHPQTEPQRQLAVAQWISAIGRRGGQRHRHGLQFCPFCLRERPAFLRRWRLSFVTACPVHRTNLHDGCPTCDAPLGLSQMSSNPPICHRCGRRLDIEIERKLGNPKSLSGRMTFQEGLLLPRGSQASALTPESPDQGFLEGLTVLLRAVQNQMRSRRRKLSTPFATLKGTFELNRTAARIQALDFFIPLLKNWPVTFLRHARSIRMTQRAFPHPGTLPPWLASAIKRLNPGTPHVGRRSRRGLWLQLHDLRRSQARGWRYGYATRMLAATHLSASK